MRNRTSIAALLFLLTLPIAFANTFGASWPIKDGRGLAPITRPLEQDAFRVAITMQGWMFALGAATRLRPWRPERFTE
jgi:hypothetical protein